MRNSQQVNIQAINLLPILQTNLHSFDLQNISSCQKVMSEAVDKSGDDNETSNLNFKQFIEINEQYLKQKFYEHFHTEGKEKNKRISITQIPIDKLFLYILEIFSLQRYQEDEKIGTRIKNSLQKNVHQYLKNLDPKQVNLKNEFDFERLKSLLTHIVQTNSIFSIQYETKNHNESNDQNSENKKQKSFQVEIKLNHQINHSTQIIDDDYNNFVNKKQKNNSFSLQNQFNLPSDTNSSISILNEQKIIKKNIKTLFDFYCRQQMELGGLITFDRLNQQTSSMSLGKCLTFAKATKIYNQFIKRQDLVSRFKKISEGKKYINNQKFQKLMEQFQLMDPSFNQRIGILTQDIRKQLKYVQLPFNTKDVQPRQKIAVRNFSSKLTQHSGQTSEELKLQLEEKKNQLMKIKKLKQFKEYMQWKQSRPDMIKQNDLKSSKTPKNKNFSVQLSFIGSIIHPQEDDETYLKDHLIPRLEKQTQKVQKYGHIFQTQRYRSHDKLTLRKQSVVSDIRKRIIEIQTNEKFSLASKLNRSQLLISSPKKKYTPM